MKPPFRPLMIVLALCSGLAHGDGDPGQSSATGPQADPVLNRVAEATRAQKWARAAGILREALLRHPDNPDYHNLFAYTMRKGSNPDMKLVFQHYRAALRLNPKHRGAHEYMGEAYLMTGNLAKAKEHLAALDDLCTFGCEEYDDLKKAVAAYVAGNR